MREALAWFETFGEPDLVSAQTASFEFMSMLRRLPQQERPRGRWLTLLGNSGTGKTRLARAIFGYWQRHLSFYAEPTTGARCGRDGLWCEFPKLVQKLRGGSYGMLDDLYDAPLLVLDEIGAERDPTGFVADVLHKLVSARVGYPTVITANLSLEALGRLDARIASRIIRDENILVNINTVDFALRAGQTVSEAPSSFSSRPHAGSPLVGGGAEDF